MLQMRIPNKKKFILAGSAVLALLFALLLQLWVQYIADHLEDQQMAARWSDNGDVAQVSCFFSPNAEVTTDTILSFEYTLKNVLKEASIEANTDNADARLWVDAYSADGKITLVNGKNSLEADAIGIGGDFFLFHPLKLLKGSYFSGNDLMQDYCIIDQDAAWQLFGSNDVVGMTVDIGNVPHIITGVIERAQGHMEKAAGLDSTVVYVSYETLNTLGTDNGINHYEITMPNPVSGFALDKVKANIGVDDKNIEVVENSNRYSLVNRLKTLLEFGTRSMNGKAIIYPYWENIARGYEDIVALLTLFMICSMLYTVTVILCLFIAWWKHKTWTVKGIGIYVGDKLERRMERRRAERQNGFHIRNILQKKRRSKNEKDNS